MLIKEVLSPVNGLFSNMPDTIWGPDFDPSFVDIELFTRLGGLQASPLMEHYVDALGVLDTSSLADLLFQRYGSNWQRVWDSLLVEYDIMLTSTLDETRSVARDTTGTETRDLMDISGGSVGIDQTSGGSATRTGSISHSGDTKVAKNLTDLQTRDLTGSNKESGTETLTDTINESTGRDNTLTFSGSEKTTLSEGETTSGDSTLTFSGSEKTTRNENETTSGENTLTKSGTEATDTGVGETRDLQKKNSGTVTDAGTETQAGTGSTTDEHGKYGIGSSALANESRDVNSETRNFTNGKNNTRTDNTTEAETGTVDTNTLETLSFTERNDKTVETGSRGVSGDDTKTFTGRNDKTVETGSRDVSGDETKTFTGRNDKTEETETRTGTVKHDTTFGKQTATTDAGTLTNTISGTEGTTDTSTETFNELKDTQAGTETKTETRNLTDKSTGTIDNAGNENVQETFHSEGSSPLRTFQALIQEELEGRSGQGWNFTDIIVKDVQSMIASRVWPRRNRYGAL